ncbi:MAG: hypothetical protein HYX78_08745 [Armatimonadetes bacterium]|nr:hypothetical protein [Armatimonadota bacterium]
MLEGLLIAAVVLNSLILVGIVVGLTVVVKRINRIVDSAEAAINEVHKELAETLRAAQRALEDAQKLAERSERAVVRVEAAARSLDRLLTGGLIASAAVKAAKGSGSTLAGVFAAVKEGLWALKSRSGNEEEGTKNE